MKLSEKEIKDLINHCRLILEGAYYHQLTDEYFKRGFLLATTEISKLFIDALNKFDINRIYEERIDEST